MLQAACGGLAEGVGFEPTVGLNPTLDFESSALNRTQPPFQMTWNYSSSAVA